MTTPNTFDSESASNSVNTNDDPTGDEALMSAIQLGDTRALETLMVRYRGLLKSVILRVVHDHATADDVLQDCLIEIWKHSAHFSAMKGKPLGWMVTMAKRRSIDHLRRQMSYCAAKDRLETKTGHYSFTQDAGVDCEDADMSRVLQQHIDELPVLQQQVIRLAFLNGMSQREVARTFHIPLGTVKTRIELGLRKLRSAFLTRHAMHSLQRA